MLLALGTFPWMSGYWANLNTPLPAGQRMIDANGTAIAVGQTIKLVGTVVSLNSTAPHFDGVHIRLAHPNGVGPLVGLIMFADPSQTVVGA